jgi:hypothetical protein
VSTLIPRRRLGFRRVVAGVNTASSLAEAASFSLSKICSSWSAIFQSFNNISSPCRGCSFVIRFTVEGTNTSPLLLCSLQCCFRVYFISTTSHSPLHSSTSALSCTVLKLTLPYISTQDLIFTILLHFIRNLSFCFEPQLLLGKGLKDCSLASTFTFWLFHFGLLLKAIRL